MFTQFNAISDIICVAFENINQH